MVGFRVWLLGIVAVSFVFAFQPYYPDLIGPLSNVLPTVCVAIAFLSAVSCMKRYGFDVRRRFQAVWFCFTLGTGLWVLAEFTWALYYFVLNVEVPYPSFADVFYLGGYVPIIAGLTLYLGDFSAGMSRRRLALAVVAIGVGVTLAMGFILPLEFSSELSAENLATNLLYPILDLVLVSLTILSLSIFIGGSLAKWWILFAAGSTLYVVGDEYFLYQIAQGSYYNGSVDDLVFLLGYLFLALAFYAHRKEL